MIAVAFGLGALVQNSTELFTAIKLCGAGYLVFLGLQAFRHRRSLAAALDQPVEPKLLRRILADGFVVGLLNPKAIVFFMAVLPQFIDPSRGSVTPQLLVLGAIFCLIALISDSLWALLAGAARAWLVLSPGRRSAIGGTGGLVMSGSAPGSRSAGGRRASGDAGRAVGAGLRAGLRS